jgi:mRNA interferase MazF
MPPTTTYQPGDLILIAFPLTSGSPGKLRPALVLLDSGDADVLVARVTMQGHNTPYDVPLIDWRAAGLLGPSVVRLHKLATLEKVLVDRQLGQLGPNDHQQVSTVLQQLFGAW